MRGALEGTKHSTVLDGLEPIIFNMMSKTHGVRKVEPLYIRWTGPRPRMLRVRPTSQPRVFEGWLFIGSAKRLSLICLEQSAVWEEVVQQLRANLTEFDVSVEILISQEGISMTQSSNLPQRAALSPVMTPEERWGWCEFVYEQVKQFKELQDEELLLEAQLEEKRTKRQQVQADAFSSLECALGVSQASA